ncbi:hypothetical protein U9M48_010787 [Paspalum notatum var. saurae]|uniref:Uncharacterized protein n=1 Tax=Paspalum notatum var. saurae TaxID=547442 RepID=A0AAQ3SUB7_PASNO
MALAPKHLSYRRPLLFAAAAMLFLFPSGSTATTFEYCNKRRDYPVKVIDVEVVPDPVVRGQPATFNISAYTELMGRSRLDANHQGMSMHQRLEVKKRQKVKRRLFLQLVPSSLSAWTWCLASERSGLLKEKDEGAIIKELRLEDPTRLPSEIFMNDPRFHNLFHIDFYNSVILKKRSNPILAQFFTLWHERGVGHGSPECLHFMIQGEWYECSYIRFARILGFGDDDLNKGHVHKYEIPRPEDVHFMYHDETSLCDYWKTGDMLPFYRYLHLLVRQTVIPKGGNETNVQSTSRTFLLFLADDDNFSIFDVIWNEILVTSWTPTKSCSHAPYIMRMIEVVAKKRFVKDVPHRSYAPLWIDLSNPSRRSRRGLESVVKKGIAAIFGVCRSMHKKIYAKKNLSPRLSMVRPYEPSFSPQMYPDNPWDYYDIMMATSDAPKDDDVDEDLGGIWFLLKKGFIAIFGLCRSMHQRLQNNIRNLHDLEETHKKNYVDKNLSPQLSPVRPYEPSFSPSMYPDNPWDYYNDIMMATNGAPRDDDVDGDHGGIRSLFKKGFIAIFGVHRSIDQDLEYMDRKLHDLWEMQKKIFAATNLSAPLSPVRSYEPLLSALVFTENPWDYYNDIMGTSGSSEDDDVDEDDYNVFGSDVGASDNSHTFLMNVVMTNRLLQHPLFI